MFWLDKNRDQISRQMDVDALPHAILIAGRAGLGKRIFAFEIAARNLNMAPPEAGATLDGQTLQAPDFYWIAPLADKQQISVDQIRELSQTLALSAHGKKKVAIIDAANRLTLAAANALLKTLEEPSGDSVLLLIADDLSRIPATIISRCAPIKISAPIRAQSVRWLMDLGHEEHAAETALTLHVDAPLAAAIALDDGSFQVLDQVWQGVLEIVSGRQQPMQLASGLSKISPALVFGALKTLVLQLIYPSSAEMRSVSGFRDYVMDSRDLFCYLDTLNATIQRSKGSYNAEIALESLLIPWASALSGCYKAEVTAV